MNATQPAIETFPAKWWMPTIPYTKIDAVNRAGLATGGTHNAMVGSHADYNGHRYNVWWNDYLRTYVADYTWAGSNRICRGDFRACLEAALHQYNRGARGASVVVTLREGDTEALAYCQERGLSTYSPEAQVAHHEATMPWQCQSYASGHTRVAIVYEARNMERQLGVPVTLFLDAESYDAWQADVRAFLEARRARNTRAN